MNTHRLWRFTALEFRTLWEGSTGRDVLPYPLKYEFTTRFRSETLALKRKAVDSVRPRFDDDLVRALEVLLAPEARIELFGRNARHRLRAHAAVHDRHGILAVQAPGADDNTGGDIGLAFLPSSHIARAVTTVLPECGPGRGKTLQVPVAELEAPPPPVRDAWRPTEREQFTKLLGSPTTAVTHIGIYPWGSPGNRHIQGRRDFQINDVDGDGRYVIFGDRTIIAKPTTADRIAAPLADMLNRTLTEVRDGVHPQP
ncbi:ESX secretion-associated protein EspG [Nocardia sp. NPDC051750]|uniref:ESX secretion-associated protein EspG n=1 Tax=Nocardia sp. NPDC051750 TaxID=3364325 RepID=UPI00379EA8B7